MSSWWGGERHRASHRTPPAVFQILENTPESHVDHSSLKLSLERAEELCSQVNEGVREKENSDRLEWIQAHVQCEGLAEVRPVQLSQCHLADSGWGPSPHLPLIWKVLTSQECWDGSWGTYEVIFSFSLSNLFSTPSPTAWDPGSFYTVENYTRPRAIRNYMDSSSMTSCFLPIWSSSLLSPPPLRNSSAPSPMLSSKCIKR